MPLRAVVVGSVFLAMLAGASPARAQAPVDTPAAWRPLRIAKWSAVTASGTAALYGFLNNRRADDAFERIEQVCVETPSRCEARLPDGAYADAALEREYQHVRSLDRRARVALVAGQVGVAASVALFILDLRNQRPPDNIPYEPRRIELAPGQSGSVRLTVRLPF